MADNKIKYIFNVEDQVSPALEKISKTAISASKEIDKAVKNAENFIKAAPNNLTGILKTQFDQFSRLRADLEKDLIKFQNAAAILRSQSSTKKQELSSFGQNLPVVTNQNGQLNVLASRSLLNKSLKDAETLISSVENRLKNIQVYGQMIELEKFFGSVFPQKVNKTITSLQAFNSSLKASNSLSWNDLLQNAESVRLKLEQTRVAELSNLDQLASRHREYSAQVVKQELDQIAAQEKKIQQIIREQLEIKKARNLFALGFTNATTNAIPENRGYTPQVTKNVGAQGYFGSFNSSGQSISNPLPDNPKILEAQKQVTEELKKQQAELNKLNFFSQSFYKRILDIAIGWRLVNSAVDIFVNLLANVPKLGIQLEQTNAIFKAVFLTTKQVNAEMEFLNILADRTGTNIGVLREQFGQFAASAVPAGETLTKIEQIFSDLTEVGAVLHLPEDRIKSIFTAVNQMYGKNQVMMEELKRQLGNQLPAAVSIFAIATGRSTKQLIADMRAGIVFPKETLSQFAATYKAIYADTNALSIATQGLNANWQRFQTSIINATQATYNSIKEYLIGGLKLATATIDTLREHSVAVTSALLLIGGVEVIAHLGAVQKALSGIFTLFGRFTIPIAVITALSLGIEKLLTVTVNVGDQTTTVGGVISTVWKDTKNAAGEYLAELIKIKEVTPKGESYKWIEELGQKFIDTGKFAANFAGAVGKTLNSDNIRYATLFDPFRNPYLLDSTKTFQESIAENLSNGGISKAIGNEIKAAAKKSAAGIPVPVKLQSEEAEAAMKRTLLATSQGSEEIASLTSQEVSRQIQLQANLSANVIKQFENQASREIEVLKRESNLVEAKLQNNQISVLGWYKKRVELIEKEYQITKAKLDLEEKQIKQNISMKSEIEGLYQPKLLGQTDAASAEKEKRFNETAILHNAGLLPYLEQVNSDNSNYLQVKKTNDELFKAWTDSLAKVREEIKSIPEDQLTPAQKLVKSNSSILMSLPYAKDIEAMAKNLENRANLEAAQKQRDYQTLKIQNDAIEFGGSLKDLIRSNSSLQGVDEKLLSALIQQESGGKQFTRSGKVLTSSAGAVGTTQVVPRFHPEFDSNKLKNDTSYNVAAGTEILKTELDRFHGDIEKALAAYNAGAGNVNKAIKEAAVKGGSFRQFLPDETKNYVTSILAKLGENIPNNVESARLDTSRATTSLTRFGVNATGQLLDVEGKRIQAEEDYRNKRESLEQQLYALEVEKNNIYKGFVIEQNQLIYGKQQEVAENEKLLKFKQIELGLDLNLLEYEKSTTEEKKKLDDAGLGKKQLEETKTAIQYLKEQIDLNAKLAKIEYDRSNVLTAISLRERDIAIQAEQGNLTPFEQTLFNSRNAQQSLPGAREQANNKIGGIQDLFNSGRISATDRDNQIKQVEQSLKDLQTQAMGTGLFFQNQLAPMIGNSFTDWANGAKSAGESFKELGFNIVKMFQDIIVQALALAAAKAAVNAVGSMFGGFGGLLSGLFSSGGSVTQENLIPLPIPSLSSGGNVVQFPFGGKVTGAGTSVSDSIQALVPEGSFVLRAQVATRLRKNRLVNLSKDEEVVPPDVVDMYGRDFFEKVNKTGKTHFADGGFVGGGTGDRYNPSNVYPINKGSSSSTTVNQITVQVNHNGKESPEDLGSKIGIEIMRKVAQQESQKTVAVYDKQQRVLKRRGSV